MLEAAAIPLELEPPLDGRTASRFIPGHMGGDSFRSAQAGVLPIKTDSAHFCEYSGRVISGLDHFCPWLGNAIGDGNRRAFVSVLTLTTISLGLIVV